jgi:hypothetical protein
VGAGYATVTESRVNAPNSFLIGETGNFLISYDRQKTGYDFTLSTAFTNQVQRDVALPDGSTGTLITETADDLKFELKMRFKLDEGLAWKPQPFLGAVFDTEFTPTVQPDGVTQNPRQQDLRGLAGVLLAPSATWKKIQLAATLRDNLPTQNLQAGVDIKTEYVKALPSLGKLSYRLTNDVIYLFIVPNPDPTALSLRYNMVHEILLPFLEDLSFSVAADVLVFRGEIASGDPALDSSEVGVNAILRFGITYNRLWKPRYQSLF